MCIKSMISVLTQINASNFETIEYRHLCLLSEVKIVVSKIKQHEISNPIKIIVLLNKTINKLSTTFALCAAVEDAQCAKRRKFLHKLYEEILLMKSLVENSKNPYNKC